MNKLKSNAKTLIKTIDSIQEKASNENDKSEACGKFKSMTGEIASLIIESNRRKSENINLFTLETIINSCQTIEEAKSMLEKI